VTYRYNGQNITTTLPYQPGSTLRVGVSVIEDQQDQRYEEPQGRRYEGRRDRPNYQ